MTIHMRIDNSFKRFTTFEVAKICGAFHTTVINWINKGKLKAHVTPGGHRRVMIGDLIEFMERYQMPIPPDLVGRPKTALIVEDNAATQRLLLRALGAFPELVVSACADGMEALIAIGKEAPDLLVLDVKIPSIEGTKVCELLRSNDHTRAIRIIAISGAVLSAKEEDFITKNADAFFRKPLSPQELKGRVAELLDLDAAEVAAPR